MNKRSEWITTRVRVGWAFLAMGIVIGLAGVLLELFGRALPFSASLITGLGILWAGIGIGLVVRYGAALKNEAAARRLTIEERDERTVQIRNQAGYRAFWASAVLVYGGLMWASFAANGSLPDLGGELLWYFLAACLIIPFGVFVASQLIDQRKG